METIAVLLLLGALGLGCMVFYVFLQFVHTARQAEERQRQLLERIGRLEEQVQAVREAVVKKSAPGG